MTRNFRIKTLVLIYVLSYFLLTFSDSLAITKDDFINKKCYSISDFYQLGVLSFYEEAKSRGDTFMKMIKKMQGSTGKLRISYKLQQGMGMGTGTAVFVFKNYVLTAGHNVSEIKQGDSTKDIEVITAKGKTFKAEVVTFSIKEGDWAVLKFLKPYRGPTASIGRYKEGDEVIMMGYPMDLAHDKNYEVQFDVGAIPIPVIGKMVTSLFRKSLYPIPLMGKIAENIKGDPTKTYIVLTVGSDILGGYSGSPIFNLKGEVIGIAGSSFTPSLRAGTQAQRFIEAYAAEKIIEKCPELADALNGK